MNARRAWLEHTMSTVDSAKRWLMNIENHGGKLINNCAKFGAVNNGVKTVADGP